MEVQVSCILGILLTSGFGSVFVYLFLQLIFVLLDDIPLWIHKPFNHVLTRKVETHHEFTTRDLLMDRVERLRVSRHFHPDIYELLYSSIQFVKSLKQE